MHSFRNLLHRLFLQGKYVLLGTILERVSFFVTFVIIARISAPTDYGLVVAAFAFCNMTHSLLDLGLSAYFQRESSNPRTELSSQLSSAFWYKALMFLPYVVVTLLYFASGPEATILSPVLIACVVFGFGVAGMLNSVLFGRSHFRESLTIQFVGRMLLLALIPVVALFRASAAAVLLVFLCSVVLQVILLVRFVRAGIVPNIGGFDPEVLWRILRQSAPMGVGLFLVAVYDRVDVLIIQKIIGLEAVASYAVAYSLYKLSLIVSGMILVPAYTIFSSEFADRGTIAGTTIRQVAFLQLGISMAVAVVLWMAPATWLSTFYGLRYRGSATVLSVVTLAVPAIFLNNLTGVVLNSMHKERLPLVSTAVGAVVNVSANIILVPRYGIVGAAIATVAAECVVLLAECVYIWQNRNLIGRSSTSTVELNH